MIFRSFEAWETKDGLLFEYDGKDAANHVLIGSGAIPVGVVPRRVGPDGVLVHDGEHVEGVPVAGVPDLTNNDHDHPSRARVLLNK